MAGKFRKRPVVVEAVQYVFDGEDIFPDQAQDAIADFMGQNIAIAGDKIVIHTLEGDIYASPGDWVIRGVSGEYYPCKPDIFAATYEPEELSAPELADECVSRVAKWRAAANDASAKASMLKAGVAMGYAECADELEAALVAAMPEPKYPDDGNGDDDSYNRGWNACRAALSAPERVDVTDEMVERGLKATRDASDARLPRYSVVRRIITAAMRNEHE